MKIKIEGMMSDHCAAHVKEALAGIAGLSRIEVDLKAGSASVQGSAPEAAIKAAIEDAGYDVTAIEK